MSKVSCCLVKIFCSFDTLNIKKCQSSLQVECKPVVGSSYFDADCNVEKLFVGTAWIRHDVIFTLSKQLFCVLLEISHILYDGM